MGPSGLLLLKNVVERTIDLYRKAHAAMRTQTLSRKATGRHIVDLEDIVCHGDELA